MSSRKYLLEGLPRRNRFWHLYCDRYVRHLMTALAHHRCSQQAVKRAYNFIGNHILAQPQFQNKNREIVQGLGRPDSVKIDAPIKVADLGVNYDNVRVVEYEGRKIELKPRSLSDVVKSHTDQGRLPYVMQTSDPRRAKFTNQFPRS